jgi:hypothetical protein
MLKNFMMQQARRLLVINYGIDVILVIDTFWNQRRSNDVLVFLITNFLISRNRHCHSYRL